MSVRNLALTFIFALLFMSFSVSAALYYNGNVSIEEIRAHIAVKNNQQAEIDLIYTLENVGTIPVSIKISFPGFPQSARYNVSETKGNEIRLNMPVGITRFSVSFNQSFDSLSKLSLSPGYNLDDKLPVKKITQQQYLLELKSQELLLISSEPELSSVGDALYNFMLANSYPKKLRLEIGSQNILVNAIRTVSDYSQVGDIINIITTVNNVGSGSLNGLSLEDSIFSAYFEPISPGFISYTTEEAGESLYIYKSSLPNLGSGENYSINYSVKVKNMGSPPFTGARILYKGNFLTSTEANQPNVFPLHVKQQINKANISESKASVAEQRLPIMQDSLNDTTTNEIQPPIFRPEEKELFYQEVEKENTMDGVFIIIIVIFIILILGAGYLAWYKYKEIIIESFSSLNLSSLKFWRKNEIENK